MLFRPESIYIPLDKKGNAGQKSDQYYALSVIQGEIIYPFELKKCCKKYKKGKRCKKCPAN